MATMTLSVMFTDLVGSTALMSRVGEEVAEELRLEHFELLRTAIGGGSGREVKNLGDGLMVVFESAADAVDVGVAIQQAFERRNRRADEPLGIRVAIAVGDVDEDDTGDVFGVPVVQAARLCAETAGGQILCTEVTRMLTGSRTGADFQPLGALDLKGLDEPVATCEVRWEPLVAVTGADLPTRLGSAIAPVFVGRSAEFEAILAAYKSATVDGTRRVMLLAGEPGIGKTTLTAQACGELTAQGARVVYGRSDEDLGVAYQPWIEALGMLVDAVAPELLTEHVAARGASVARLVPGLAARVGIEPPEGPVGDAERYVLFGAVTDLLSRATATDPVVLVVDDLHWSDRQSLQLLRHVVTAGEPMRLLIIGTFRDSEVQAGDPLSELLAVFHREDGVDRLALGGLGDADLLEFLERAAGHEMDEAGIGLRDAVLAETAGNPFFVGEILRHLRDSGAITQDGGRWVGTVDLAEVGLPVSVTEVVGRRIGVLGDETRKVLAAGAVMGRDFDIDIVAQVTGVDEDTVIDLCDAAVDASVLTTTDRVGVYSFAHALIGHTLVQGLSATRRARMHRAVADAIEASGDPETRAGELANHWANAVHVDADKVVTYEVLAGRQALAQLAPDVAVDWFTRALEHHGTGGVDEARRVEILIGLGDAQKQSGLGDFRATLLEAAAIADRLGLAEELARAVMLNSRQHHSNIDGVDGERVHFIERALETTITDEDRALLLALLATERLNVTAVEARLELVDQALACSAHAPPAVRAAVLLRACRAVPGPSALERRIGWAEAAQSLVELLDDPHLALECAFLDVSLGLVQGDAASMHQGANVVGEILEHVQEATRRWAHRYCLATVAVIDGDLDRAEAIAEDALQLGLAAEQADAFSLYGAQILGIRNQQGRIEEMIPLLEDIVAQQPDRTVYLATLAMARAETGDTARAQDLVDTCRDKGFSGLWDLDYTIGLAALAKAILILGDTTSAKALRPLLVEYPEQIATTQVSVSCALAYWLGRIDHLLGDVDSAEHWLTVADRIHRRFESPLLIAYSDVAIAALSADRGRPADAERARQLAEAAFEVASTRGYVPVARDARAVLDRL